MFSLSFVCISSVFTSVKLKKRRSAECLLNDWWSLRFYRNEWRASSRTKEKKYLNDFSLLWMSFIYFVIAKRFTSFTSIIKRHHTFMSFLLTCHATRNLLILNGSPGNRCCKISTRTKHRYLWKTRFLLFVWYFFILILMGVSISDQIMLDCDFNWIYPIVLGTWWTSAARGWQLRETRKKYWCSSPIKSAQVDVETIINWLFFLKRPYVHKLIKRFI